MDLGERQFEFPNKVLVIFDNESTIKFYKKDELILQLDPSELSVLWASYKAMAEESYQNDTIKDPNDTKCRNEIPSDVGSCEVSL